MIAVPERPVEPLPEQRESDPAEREGGRVYVHPGQLTVAIRPCTITAIVGSCVAVSVFDPVARIGGLNHFLLPQSSERSDSLRFGDVAVPRLIAAMVEYGAVQHRLEAKVVGGASVLERYRDHPTQVGRQNVHAARKALLAAGIPVVMQDVEGNRGRFVTLQAHTGALTVRVL